MEFAEKSLDLATKRLVLNIEGEEVVPSDQWIWSAFHKMHASKYDNPIDPTYKRTVPVMVRQFNDPLVSWISLTG